MNTAPYHILISRLVLKFLKHRAIIMKQYGGRADVRRWDALDKMQKQLEAMPPQTLRAACNYVITHEGDLRLLLPGESSKFQKEKRSIIMLIEDCKNYMNQLQPAA